MEKKSKINAVMMKGTKSVIFPARERRRLFPPNAIVNRAKTTGRLHDPAGQTRAKGWISSLPYALLSRVTTKYDSHFGSEQEKVKDFVWV